MGRVGGLSAGSGLLRCGWIAEGWMAEGHDQLIAASPTLSSLPDTSLAKWKQNRLCENISLVKVRHCCCCSQSKVVEGMFAKQILV